MHGITKNFFKVIAISVLAVGNFLQIHAQSGSRIIPPILYNLKPEQIPIDPTWEQFSFSANGSCLIIPNGYDVDVFNASTMQKYCRIHPPNAGDYNFGCAISRDGNNLYIASGSGVFLYDAHSGKLLHQTKDVCLDRLVALSSDEQLVASAPRLSGNKVHLNGISQIEGDKVTIWRADTLEFIRTFEPIPNYLGGISFSAKNEELLRIGHYGTQIWDVETGKIRYQNKVWMNGTPVWLFKSGRVFGSGAVTTPAEMLQISSGKPLPVAEESGASGNWCSALSPDQRWMIGAVVRGRNSIGFQYVYVWDANTGILRFRIPGCSSGCSALGFSPDGRWLYASTPRKNGFIRWDLSKSKYFSSISPPQSP